MFRSIILRIGDYFVSVTNRSELRPLSYVYKACTRSWRACSTFPPPCSTCSPREINSCVVSRCSQISVKVDPDCHFMNFTVLYRALITNKCHAKIWPSTPGARSYTCCSLPQILCIAFHLVCPWAQPLVLAFNLGLVSCLEMLILRLS
jgi:hypothetical protein